MIVREQKQPNCSYSPQYLPRKGTETVVVEVEDYMITCIFATIFTPQGDGNASALLKKSFWLEFATIFTPQGDGNYLSDKSKRIKPTEFATIFTPQGDGNAL